VTVRVSVITPTIGSPALADAVRSVAAQSHPARHVVVVDGAVHEPAVRAALAAADVAGPRRPEVVVLPDNTGRDLNNGHRIYHHVAPLLDTDHVALLDEDNAYEPDHVGSLLPISTAHGAAWSLRRLLSRAGEDLGVDRVESIGRPVGPAGGTYVLVDTSCWMLRRDQADLLAAIDRPWDGDRRLTATVLERVGDLERLGSDRATLRYTVPDRLVEAFRSALARAVRSPDASGR
jgi:hypothetical protein